MNDNVPRVWLQRIGILCFALLTTCSASAELTPLAPADTSSPRATLTSFQAACQELYNKIRANTLDQAAEQETLQTIQRASSCLDLSEIPEAILEQRTRESILQLKEVLDRIKLPSTSRIPGGKELPDSWTVPGTEIVIRKIQEGAHTGEYLFSADTVRRSAEFYGLVEHLPYKKGATRGFYDTFRSEPRSRFLRWLIRLCPDWIQHRVLDTAIWQWIGTLLACFGGIYAMTLCYRLSWRMQKRAKSARGWRTAVSLLFPVAALLMPIWIKHILADVLVVSGGILLVATVVLNAVVVFAMVALVLGLGNRLIERVVASERLRIQSVDPLVVRLIGRVLTIGAAVIIFIEGCKGLGIPMSTLLAGAGVGGIALALGAQDAIKNLVGSMMILMDRPYSVGDRIVVKGHDGVVEDIGLRSTKLRLLTGHQTSIPNEQMASNDIENIGRRPHIRQALELPLALTVTAEQAGRAVELVREILDEHQGMLPERPPRVFLDRVDREAILLRALAWYHPADFWAYAEWEHGIILRVLAAFADAGIELVGPARRVSLPDGSSTQLVTPTDAPGPDA